MTDPHPTAILREEHQQILQVVSVLDELLQGDLEVTSTLERVARCVRFLRLYADACHHGKEEDLLFPVLEEHGIPTDSGAVAVMMEEHRQARKHLSDMTAALEGAREGNHTERDRLLEAGWDYIDLIRSHIGKEDGGVFEMADQVVSAPACARLCAAYEKTCASRFDGCTKAELEELARDIVAASP